VVAALAVIVVVGTNQTVGTPPVPDSLSADAPSGFWSPSDSVSIPAPWGVRIPQIRTPGPVVPEVHVGFRDLPDLSAPLEAGVAPAGIRGGTSLDGLPTQVDAAVVASTVGLVAALTTVVGVVRRWPRWRGAARNAIDRNHETTGTDGDDLLVESEDAGEPLRDAFSDRDPVEPLGENSVVHGSAGESPARDTAAPEEAARGPRGEAEEPPQAVRPERDPAPSPPTGRRSATPSEATDGPTRSGEEASSRVVLFTATKWGE
jgi:hypothetical protein